MVLNDYHDTTVPVFRTIMLACYLLRPKTCEKVLEAL